MIKWNEEYQVYVSDDGRIFNKKMKEYKLHTQKNGYLFWSAHRHGKNVEKLVHRLIYSTFYGDIPNDMQIDHIDRDRTNNKLTNLRCITPQQNSAHKLESYTGFGEKFIEHFGIRFKDNKKLYHREKSWFYNHGKCRWE